MDKPYISSLSTSANWLLINWHHTSDLNYLTPIYSHLLSLTIICFHLPSFTLHQLELQRSRATCRPTNKVDL